ncbi:hypothetical protein [Enterococcus ureasiticus]|uniref:Uncharacterized protein n=1 Tax=Enterococcus ureasiticus TaxID=903984 RepID=A0A1E5GFZ8_9ENTE|nr:hypothetical protein [Enterococcus ureasiticus]OEG11551.1 hypothetical protein BCR21_09665 [Enterococcus ureasiticus]
MTIILRIAVYSLNHPGEWVKAGWDQRLVLVNGWLTVINYDLKSKQTVLLDRNEYTKNGVGYTSNAIVSSINKHKHIQVRKN